MLFGTITDAKAAEIVRQLIALADDAELAPHGNIRVESERADAGLPELGEGRCADRLAHREV